MDRKTTLWCWYVLIWLGFWLLAAPFAFGYSQKTVVCSDLISGILLIVFASRARSPKALLAPWILCLIGCWLQLAPLVFWAKNPSAYLNDTLVGILAIALSVLIPGLPGRQPDTGPSLPPGWSYNPSSWPQRLPIVVLGTIGWFISRYLCAVQLGYIETPWDPIFGTGTLKVITSDVSKAFPIPDAGLGAMAYTFEVLLALKGDERRWRTMPWMVLLFGLIAVPVGIVSITLIIMQPLVVGSWCFLCLCTAFCMTLLIAFAIDEVVLVFQFLRRERFSWSLFWKGGACPGAKSDTRTPSMDASLKSLLLASSWGISLSWNLILSTLLGILLMLLPSFYFRSDWIANLDHVIGAFAIVVSIISQAEVIRKARLLNILFGASLFIALEPFHFLLGIFLMILSVRSGRCFESAHIKNM